jgi:hypothetical protein
MKRFTRYLVSVLQVILAAVALWVLYDTKASSEWLSRHQAGKPPLEFTWIGILMPVVLSLTISLCAVLNAPSRRSARTRSAASLALLPIVLVLSWWLALLVMGCKSFFVQSGALPPNEILGPSWPLFIVVALLSMAAVLGAIFLVLNWRDTAGVT